MNKGKQTMYRQQICEEVWKEKVNKSDCLKKDTKKKVKKKRKIVVPVNIWFFPRAFFNNRD